MNSIQRHANSERTLTTKMKTGTKIAVSRKMSAKRKTIAIVCPMFGASKVYYANLLAAITNKSTELHYQTVIVALPDYKNKGSLRNFFPSVAEVDGLILITCQVEDSTWLKECKSMRKPVVLLDDNISPEKATGFTVVGMVRPKLTGLVELVDHLAQHSCRNLAVVTVDPAKHAIRRHKLEEIMRAARRYSLVPEYHEVKEYTQEDGYRVVDRILERNQSTDAIICLADITAIGILRRLQDLGLQDRIRVTGFDDIEDARFNDLSTINQQLETKGETAMERLHEAIKKGLMESHSPDDIPVEFKRRTSCCFNERKLPSSEGRRYGISFLVDNIEAYERVQLLRSRIVETYRGKSDSLGLIGNASMYPLHITVIGNFTPKSLEDLAVMCTEISESLKKLESFVAYTGEFLHHPRETTLSVGLTPPSAKHFHLLQRAILEIVRRHRRTETEPEFAQFRRSDDRQIRLNVQNYGEPNVGRQYEPHITLLSGLRNDVDYKFALEEAGKSDVQIDYPLRVSRLWLIEEQGIGGSWKPIRTFELLPSIQAQVTVNEVTQLRRGGNLYLGFDFLDGKPFGFPSSKVNLNIGVFGPPKSGKTVLAKDIIEELAIQGVNVVVFDLKGDLIGLAFEPKETVREDLNRFGLTRTDTNQFLSSSKPVILDGENSEDILAQIRKNCSPEGKGLLSLVRVGRMNQNLRREVLEKTVEWVMSSYIKESVPLKLAICLDEFKQYKSTLGIDIERIIDPVLRLERSRGVGVVVVSQDPGDMGSESKWIQNTLEAIPGPGSEYSGRFRITAGSLRDKQFQARPQLTRHGAVGDKEIESRKPS